MRRGLSRRTCTALAIAAYLVVSLFAFRNIAAAPSTLLAYPSVVNDKIRMIILDHRDQAMVVSTIARNAHILATKPWDLFADAGQCYPMPGAHTLGEHMFGTGLLATLPYGLTRDPILSYNFALILTIWIPAITMYFLSLRFTRSPGAAFVAGLAFALAPGRLIDPSHPYVHGDLWAPAVLLFLHRLFVHAKWRDAFLLALFLNLEVFESLYPLISTCLLASVYGLYLVYRHKENVLRVLPKLVTSLGLVALGAWLVLGPYLATSATWDLLKGRQSILLNLSDFLPGQGDYFPGFVVVFFLAIAMLDRLRGSRVTHGEDPRLAFFIGGLFIAWSSLGHTEIPALGLAIESPFLTFRDVIPGLSAVRAIASIAIGSGIASSFLAGFGVLVLTERLRPAPWLPVAGALVCAFAILSARFVPALAEASFGRTFRLTSYTARPPQEDIDLLRSVGHAPQIDFPLARPTDGRMRLDVAEALLLASYDPRPLAGCYNSFVSPVNEQVIALTRQLPSPPAVEALGALGFETLLVHRARAGKQVLADFNAGLRNDPSAMEVLQPIGDTQAIDAYRIRALHPVTSDFAALQPEPGAEPLEAMIPRPSIPFSITNLGEETFRHPEPLQPTDLVIRWRDGSGRLAREQELRALLPVALAPGGTTAIPLVVHSPDEAGDYVATLSRVEAPDRVIARQEVHLPALEDIMTPAQIAVHLHRDFINDELVQRGMATAFGPVDEVEIVLGPDASSAAEMRAYGRLAAHWFSGFDESSSTTLIDADVHPTGIAGRVRLRIPIPTTLGLHTLLITPPDDPTTLLAGKMVFPDVETARALAEAAQREAP